MSEPRVSVVIPTLAAGPALLECLQALGRQTRRDIEVIVVDNSGVGLSRKLELERLGATGIENDRNVGFAAAINAGFRCSRAPFLATLNDDAVPHPDWICALLAALESRADAGMGASRVRLAEQVLDSAGMLVAFDGSSKQRGHLEAPEQFSRPEEILFPSACAALYRRSMLEEIGLFDEDFFLYCEDSDLGLRARWAGWKCLYVPEAVVDHRYSETAGRASPLKAYYVERNRLFLLVKNFPAGLVARAPLVTVARYWWHAVSMFVGHGRAAEFRRAQNPLQLVFIVLRAHGALVFSLAPLLKKRREIRRRARISAREFRHLLAAHSITARQVASL